MSTQSSLFLQFQSTIRNSWRTVNRCLLSSFKFVIKAIDMKCSDSYLSTHSGYHSCSCCNTTEDLECIHTKFEHEREYYMVRAVRSQRFQVLLCTYRLGGTMVMSEGSQTIAFSPSSIRTEPAT